MQYQFRILHVKAYDFFMIDLQGLRALVAVDRDGSVVAAADRLGYTASAVSQQVKKLERDLDAVLLERRGRGVLLTDHGRALASEGRELLAGLERLEGLAASDVRRSAPLRIASFSTATRGLVGPLLRELRSHDAPIAATVTSVDPVDAMGMVADGIVDLAIVHNWNSVPLVTVASTGASPSPSSRSTGPTRPRVAVENEAIRSGADALEPLAASASSRSRPSRSSRPSLARARPRSVSSTPRPRRSRSTASRSRSSFLTCCDTADGV